MLKIKPLWKITGLGPNGPATVHIAADDYAEAVQRFQHRHRNIRIIDIVKLERDET